MVGAGDAPRFKVAHDHAFAGARYGRSRTPATWPGTSYAALRQPVRRSLGNGHPEGTGGWHDPMWS